MMMDKQVRQRKIRELVLTKTIRTQKELLKLLRLTGCDVSLSTISRDMKELHIIKKHFPDGGSYYSLSASIKDCIKNPIKSLQALFADAIISVHAKDYFVMIKTIPGNAKAIGYIMECLNWKEVKGVISGNDQCFLLCRTEKEAEDMKRKCLSIWNKG